MYSPYESIKVVSAKKYGCEEVGNFMYFTVNKKFIKGNLDF